jgi:hypothetical protein
MRQYSELGDELTLASSLFPERTDGRTNVRRFDGVVYICMYMKTIVEIKTQVDHFFVSRAHGYTL